MITRVRNVRYLAARDRGCDGRGRVDWNHERQLNGQHDHRCAARSQPVLLHLPPELRDFRIELRDIDFSFLPGNASSVELEALTLYEFNGGNQVPSSDPSRGTLELLAERLQLLLLRPCRANVLSTLLSPTSSTITIIT